VHNDYNGVTFSEFLIRDSILAVAAGSIALQVSSMSRTSGSTAKTRVMNAQRIFFFAIEPINYIDKKYINSQLL
jgi:hypothetical protein